MHVQPLGSPGAGIEPPSIRWWQWPTVLSLDAPAVVLVWQRVLADVAQVRLGWPPAFVLGASVWLAYAADRWIEGWRLAPAAVRTERHAFSQRTRWPLFGVWLAVAAADLVVALRGLSTGELEAGWLLLLPVLAYLLSHQLVHRTHPWRAPKEVVVALLLGTGAVLFPFAHPGPAARHLWTSLALFVLLCFANCALISAWEREVDRSHGQTSLALQFPSARWIHALPWLLATAALVVGGRATGSVRTAALCAAASAGLLGLVDAGHARLGRRLARVLADAALLTPVVAMVAGALR